MNPLAIKYGLMAVAFIGWTSAVAWTVADYKDAKWKAAYAAQEQVAGALLNNAYAEKAEAEKKSNDKAREVDEKYAQDMAAADAGRDDFNKRLRDAKRRACGGSPPTGQAVNPGIGTEPTGSGDGRSGEPNSASRLRDYALALQRYAVACHEWAVSVGR